MTMFAPTAPVRMACNQAMTFEEASSWIDRYNRWVELWNKHETSQDLPLNPEWLEADKVASGIGSIPNSVLAFVPKGTRGLSGPLGLIRLNGWVSYHKGWSMCRNLADASKIIWAGWRLRS